MRATRIVGCSALHGFEVIQLSKLRVNPTSRCGSSVSYAECPDVACGHLDSLLIARGKVLTKSDALQIQNYRLKQAVMDHIAA